MGGGGGAAMGGLTVAEERSGKAALSTPVRLPVLRSVPGLSNTNLQDVEAMEGVRVAGRRRPVGGEEPLPGLPHLHRPVGAPHLPRGVSSHWRDLEQGVVPGPPLAPQQVPPGLTPRLVGDAHRHTSRHVHLAGRGAMASLP